MLKKTVLTVLIFIMTAVFFRELAAASSGSSGAEFLKIPAGTRPAAMGNAYSALSDDVSGALWNPAGISGITKKEISALHTIWLGDISGDFLGAALPLENYTFALTALLFKGEDEYRGASPGSPLSGSFSISDRVYALSAARKQNERYSAGLSVKVISRSIEKYSALAAAVDIGAIVKVNSDLSAAAAIQNLGTRIRLRNEAEPLPLTLRAGLLLKGLNGKMLFAFDAVYASGSPMSLNMGGEYKVLPLIAVRAGYIFKTGKDNPLSLTGITAGFGLSLKGMSLDYSYIPYNRLGDSHQFSLSYKF